MSVRASVPLSTDAIFDDCMPDPQTIYTDFGAMMRQVVIPMHMAEPSHARLDSPRTDGNWDVLCRFQWKARVWKVHMDSHFEPLMLAYYGWQYSLGDDVFVESAIETGVRLDIVDVVAAIRPTRHRYLYLYRDDTDRPI
jgi:hypothetical protein